MKLRLHYWIITLLIKMWSGLFERYLDEYLEVYNKYLK